MHGASIKPTACPAGARRLLGIFGLGTCRTCILLPFKKREEYKYEKPLPASRKYFSGAVQFGACLPVRMSPPRFPAGFSETGGFGLHVQGQAILTNRYRNHGSSSRSAPRLNSISTRSGDVG